MSDMDRWSWRDERMYDADRQDLVLNLRIAVGFLSWAAVLSLVAYFVLYPHSVLYAGFVFGWASVPLPLLPNIIWHSVRILRKHRKRKRMEAVAEVLE